MLFFVTYVVLYLLYFQHMILETYKLKCIKYFPTYNKQLVFIFRRMFLYFNRTVLCISRQQKSC